MRTFLIITCLFLTTSISAQEWGNVKGNTLTMKELAPIWPGCQSNSATQRDHCFKQKLSRHIAKNFKYPAGAYKNNEQGRVVVTFLVNKQGEVEIQKVSGGTAALQTEAKRNIMSIPKMTKPGMMGGKPRAIQYTVPITFKTGK